MLGDLVMTIDGLDDEVLTASEQGGNAQATAQALLRVAEKNTQAAAALAQGAAEDGARLQRVDASLRMPGRVDKLDLRADQVGLYDSYVHQATQAEVHRSLSRVYRDRAALVVARSQARISRNGAAEAKLVSDLQRNIAEGKRLKSILKTSRKGQVKASLTTASQAVRAAADVTQRFRDYSHSPAHSRAFRQATRAVAEKAERERQQLTARLQSLASVRPSAAQRDAYKDTLTALRFTERALDIARAGMREQDELADEWRTEVDGGAPREMVGALGGLGVVEVDLSGLGGNPIDLISDTLQEADQKVKDTEAAIKAGSELLSDPNKPESIINLTKVLTKKQVFEKVDAIYKSGTTTVMLNAIRSAYGELTGQKGFSTGDTDAQTKAKVVALWTKPGTAAFKTKSKTVALLPADVLTAIESHVKKWGGGSGAAAVEAAKAKIKTEAEVEEIKGTAKGTPEASYDEDDSGEAGSSVLLYGGLSLGVAALAAGGAYLYKRKKGKWPWQRGLGDSYFVDLIDNDDDLADCGCGG